MCVLSCQKLKYYAGRPPSHSGSQQTDTFQIMSKLFSTYPDIFTKFPEKKILVRCNWQKLSHFKTFSYFNKKKRMQDTYLSALM